MEPNVKIAINNSSPATTPSSRSADRITVEDDVKTGLIYEAGVVVAPSSGSEGAPHDAWGGSFVKPDDNDSFTTRGAGGSASPPKWLVCTVSLFSGVSALWYWNSILNLSELINGRYFSDYEDNISNIMTFAFELSAVASFLICYKMDATSASMQLTCAICSFVLAFIPPLLLLITQPLTRYVLWLISSGLFGLWLGLEQICHFGLAANLPTGVTTVYISSGCGIGGIISFALFWLIVKAEHVTPWQAMTVQMCLLIVITILGPLGMWYVRTRPAVDQYIALQKKLMAAGGGSSGHVAVVAGDGGGGGGGEEVVVLTPNGQEVVGVASGGDDDAGVTSFTGLIKMGWFPLLNILMTFLFSYIVFPNIGPFKWPVKRDDQVDIVMGFSQLGQMLGRSAPLIAAFQFSINTTFILNCIRIIFPILFTIAAVQKSNEAFASYPFQCIMLFALSLSEGWLASLGLLHTALAGSTIYQRAELSKFGSVLLTIAISAGLGLTFALRAAAGIE